MAKMSSCAGSVYRASCSEDKSTYIASKQFMEMLSAVAKEVGSTVGHRANGSLAGSESLASWADATANRPKIATKPRNCDGMIFGFRYQNGKQQQLKGMEKKEGKCGRKQVGSNKQLPGT